MQLASFSTRIQIAHAPSSRFLELTTQGLSSVCTAVNSGLKGAWARVEGRLGPHVGESGIPEQGNKGVSMQSSRY